MDSTDMQSVVQQSWCQLSHRVFPFWYIVRGVALSWVAFRYRRKARHPVIHTAPNIITVRFCKYEDLLTPSTYVLVTAQSGEVLRISFWEFCCTDDLTLNKNQHLDPLQNYSLCTVASQQLCEQIGRGVWTPPPYSRFIGVDISLLMHRSIGKVWYQ